MKNCRKELKKKIEKNIKKCPCLKEILNSEEIDGVHDFFITGNEKKCYILILSSEKGYQIFFQHESLNVYGGSEPYEELWKLYEDFFYKKIGYWTYGIKK